MPPHCDTRDGPVVIAAKRALETGNVNLILPWVQKSAEDEVKKCVSADSSGKETRKWFNGTCG